MRIALLTDGIYPYVVGGMQKHSYQLVRQLAQNNHTVYLFHCNESSYDASNLEFFSEEEKKNIRPFLIPFPHKSYYPLHYIYESKEYAQAIYNKIRPLLGEIDFIFAQGFCAWELLKHKDNCPPIAVHLHGLEMFQNIPSLKAKIGAHFLRTAAEENLSNADYVISFGGRITDILRQFVTDEKIWEVPGGIESLWLTDKIKPAAEKVRFFFIGRYERRKGIPELNKAIEQLLPNNNFTFDFIGDIPGKYKIASPLLHYHGKLSSEEEIKRLLSQGDVLVCPSYAEGMPIAIMEGMACGLAIIATDVGSVSTLVDSANGWLLPKPVPDSIANAMLDAINGKATLTSKKEASVRKIKNSFLAEMAVTKLIALMQQHTKRVVA